MPSRKLAELSPKDLAPSWSFVAAPIKQESTDLYGVITMGQPVQCNPFSADDVTLFESIARRLATVMSNIRMLEERTHLMMSLAHEINTPLQVIRSNLELMQTFDLEPDERRKCINVSIRQIEYLASLTRRVRDFAQPADETRYSLSITLGTCT